MKVDLPIIVCGKKIVHDGSRETITITTENGDQVRFPALTEEDIREIEDSRLNTHLHETHIDDITIFFQKIARFWQQKENKLRDEAIKYCSCMTGFAEYSVLRDYMLFSQVYATRSELYDQLEAELGDIWYLEEWLPVETCYIHAQPMGMVTNILVGNVPLSSLTGMFRSLIVKNNTLCKLAKRDPITALYFGLSFLELEPDHPITKSLSIVYWDKNSWQEERLLHSSDAVCVWGGETAVNEVKKKIRSGTKLLEFGPKRSISLVDLTAKEEGDTIDDIAHRVAHDFSTYNQEACFSSQELFIIADDMMFSDFLENLKQALDFYLIKFPKIGVMDDSKAHVYLTRLEHMIEGDEVIATENHNWTIIITSSKKRVINHPLNRTVIIHRIDKPEEVLEFVNTYTQTVVMYPWKMSEVLRESITLKGVDRIAAIGMSGSQRAGAPHDGMKIYAELVRWVTVERGLDYKSKYYTNDKRSFVDGLFKSVWDYWNK
jgi:long-chain-fatty-acyl-CoA reductase